MAVCGEINALVLAWSEADLARAGVIAVWRNGRVSFVTGLVRPEDRRRRRPAKETDAPAGDNAPDAEPVAV